jgi:hypothetical protein
VKKGQKERAAPQRVNRGNWDAVPVGRRLTLTEAAGIIGISRLTLRKNYAGASAPRTLPPGFRLVSEPGSHSVFLMRSRVAPVQLTPEPIAAGAAASDALEGIRELSVSDRRSQGKGFCVVGAHYDAQGRFDGYPVLQEGLTEPQAGAIMALMQKAIA